MKCPNCKRKIKTEDKACPYCGTWIGLENRIPKETQPGPKSNKWKKLKENPWIGLIVESNKPLFILAASWLFFFLALMLLVYIFG